LEIALVALAVLVLFPYYWMVVSSFKAADRIFAIPMTLVPTPFTTESYTKLITTTLYLRWYANSVLITVCYSALAVFFSSLGGFGLSKYAFGLRNALFLVVVSSMMIPLHSILIPLFTILIRMKWIDTYHGVILPFAASPFGIFFVRQYLHSVPNELLYAGRIDGCTEFGVYFKIVLPLLRPAVGVLVIYFSMISWNWFIWPLVVLRDSRMFPLTVGLATFINQYKVKYDEVMAGAVLCSVPLIAVSLAMQKQFVSGLTAGAVKQ